MPEPDVTELVKKPVPPVCSYGDHLQLHSLQASLPRSVNASDMPLVSFTHESFFRLSHMWLHIMLVLTPSMCPMRIQYDTAVHSVL